MGVGIAMAWKGNEVTDVYQKSISEKKYHQDVGPSEEYMWGGLSLQYFLFINSSAYDDARSPIYQIAKVFLDNGDELKTLLDLKEAPQQKNELYFFMSAVCNLIGLSKYGMSSYQEFFAECFAKWQTMPERARNKSWELLNFYFLHCYPFVKNKYSGILTGEKDEEMFDYFEKHRVPKQLIYNLDIDHRASNALTYQDLYYTEGDLGYHFKKDIDGIKNKNSITNYELVSYIAALNYWVNAGALSPIEGKKKQADFAQWLLSYNQKSQMLADSFYQVNNWTNDSFTRASEKSINEFDYYVAISRNDYFNSFDKLDKYMLKHTKVASGKATIALKKSIDEMAKTYYWGQEKTRRFKEQILDMFNVSCEMAQFRGKDYLTHFITGLIFTPDYPMRDNEIGIMAYTQTAYYGGDDFSTSAAYSQIVYSGRPLDTYTDPEDNNRYNDLWWSSPNIFATLNHEFGHVMDAYLGLTWSAAEVNLTNYQKLLNGSNIYDRYKGSIFGYTNWKEEHLKDWIEISEGIVGAVMLSVSVVFTTICKKIYH
jgi:hypothetical protein